MGTDYWLEKMKNSEEIPLKDKNPKEKEKKLLIPKIIKKKTNNCQGKWNHKRLFFLRGYIIKRESADGFLEREEDKNQKNLLPLDKRLIVNRIISGIACLLTLKGIDKLWEVNERSLGTSSKESSSDWFLALMDHQ